uniref:3-oxoacyl-[acyl-carrier-protein] reductase n=1 Tax=Caenorhabditis tropicalis TaxID=1561998 RepID=A0A1I7UBE7_9PELO
MPRFTGKTVIITGSSNGIGRSAALLFALDGANVTITGRNSERLEETKQLLLKSGVSEKQVNSVVADVTSSDGQDQLVKTTLDKFGRIDVLVNNAGAAITDNSGATGTDQSLDLYHKTLHLNLQAVVEMTKKVKPHLMKTKGEIVNISSIGGGPHAQPDFIYYAMAKAALDQYTRSAAIDLIQHGIRVNSVSPGIVSTGFVGAMGLDNQASQNFYDSLSVRKHCIPAGMAGNPEDIANIILFLADRKLSSYIIGQSIVADGGSTLVLGLQADMKELSSQ